MVVGPDKILPAPSLVGAIAGNDRTEQRFPPAPTNARHAPPRGAPCGLSLRRAAVPAAAADVRRALKPAEQGVKHQEMEEQARALMRAQAPGKLRVHQTMPARPRSPRKTMVVDAVCKPFWLPSLPTR